LTSGGRLPVIIFNFWKSTSGDTFWLPEVDFRWYILTFESRLPVIHFDFWKSTSGDTFWFPEIDSWWYILTSESQMTFGSRYNFESMVYADFLKWSKEFFGNLKKFGRYRRNFRGARRKTLSANGTLSIKRKSPTQRLCMQILFCFLWVEIRFYVSVAKF